MLPAPPFQKIDDIVGYMRRHFPSAKTVEVCRHDESYFHGWKYTLTIIHDDESSITKSFRYGWGITDLGMSDDKYGIIIYGHVQRICHELKG